ncbi:DIS3-like exonuclease 2 [Cornus florida]|uniref:DIS3-like exonuclease 2 n=1 Tax=Cornus florida TaxID=4283 RepID=UPI00289E2039|nr:DIS3-like exonuclease 2 [Cornus florida]XP_059630777.1 DIS3-like exonuclease 2 [Cornus florida]
MRGGVVDQSPNGKIDDVEKDKKKKRRPNRRPKQNSSVPACSSVNEIRGKGSEFLGSGSPSNHVLGNGNPSNHVILSERQPPEVSNVAFHSLPTMHINEQATSQEGGNMQNQQMFPSDVGERTFSKSCPVPINCGESMVSYVNKDFLLSQQICHVQRKCFDSHWSVEAVNEALEKGDVFKALFHVNAHNRLEAYCKIDGVPVDVLISGIAAQNRAVDGDIVAIKVDPLSSWTKMKGSNGPSNNSALMDDNNLVPEVTESVGNGDKGKGVLHVDIKSNTCLLPEKGFYFENGSFSGESVNPELIGPVGCNYVNGHYPSAPDMSRTGGSSERNEIASLVGKFCALVSSFPSKRPTGRVVAIVERSTRRDAVVGFLNAKQCVSSREGYRKDGKKKKNSLVSPNHDYIMLTPTNPKFPKMMVFVRDLPDSIKKKLDDCDATVEMELVAAQIDDWGEDNCFPQAHILHIFGRGGEIGPQIAAILFENAIISSEFSSKSLSCLPHLPWEVPQGEFQSRRDLRNLCIFTIDPPSARDLDDALSVERLSNGIFRVGVHIADASYFVLPDTALDIEAQVRSTSIYMLQRKLPMLPSLLSENIASLNPGVDRLAFSIFWDINSSGEILDRWIGRTVIRSCCKFSYDNAQDIIDGLVDVGSFNSLGNTCPQLYGNFEWSDLFRSVKSLQEISQKLKENRFKDGALSLESSKVFFLFDEEGIPYDSMLSGRKDSEYMVEEFMLLANRTAAEVIYRAYPDSALLRRHPEPNLRKLRELETFCGKHGLELDTSSSGQLHHSIERIREKLKNDSVLFNILLSYATKPMQLATYFCSGELKDSENNCGHYALAVPFYTHFTSTLRRYPDILVHRTLVAAIEAEELYLKHKRTFLKLNKGEENTRRCFTGICFDKDAAESDEGQEALSAAASKYRVPCTEILADVAAYCNERKLAGRHAKDASDKLYMWALLKKKKNFLSEARVLGLGPRFMTIYIHKLAIERRIYYDEVEDLRVEWLDATSTLVLSLSTNKRIHWRSSPGKWRTVEEVALVTNPLELKLALDLSGDSREGGASEVEVDTGASYGNPARSLDVIEIEPAVFPLTVHLLSTIPVVLFAVGGDDGPLDIGARLFMSSYLCT